MISVLMSLAKADSREQLSKPRVAAQRIERGLDLELNDRSLALIDSLGQPVKSLIAIAELDVNICDHDGGYIAAG